MTTDKEEITDDDAEIYMVDGIDGVVFRYTPGQVQIFPLDPADHDRVIAIVRSLLEEQK